MKSNFKNSPISIDISSLADFSPNGGDITALQISDRDRSRTRSRDDVILPLQNRTSLVKFKNRTISKIDKVQVKEADTSTYNKEATLWFEKYNQEFKSSQTAKLLVYGV